MSDYRAEGGGFKPLDPLHVVQHYRVAWSFLSVLVSSQKKVVEQFGLIDHVQLTAFRISKTCLCNFLYLLSKITHCMCGEGNTPRS